MTSSCIDNFACTDIKKISFFLFHIMHWHKLRYASRSINRWRCYGNAVFAPMLCNNDKFLYFRKNYIHRTCTYKCMRSHLSIPYYKGLKIKCTWRLTYMYILLNTNTSLSEYYQSIFTETWEMLYLTISITWVNFSKKV